MKYFFIELIFLIFAGCSSLLAQERGMASFYSNKMHGRRMSNGERYHRDSLTCAHARYALGTLLKVTNVKTGKNVVVRVTDRCAAHRRRIIDLSMAAAKELGIVQAGIAMVTVEQWHHKHQVPFLDDDDAVELPELDFEVTKNKNTGSEGYAPPWRKDAGGKGKKNSKNMNSQNKSSQNKARK